MPPIYGLLGWMVADALIVLVLVVVLVLESAVLARIDVAERRVFPKSGPRIFRKS